jgi:hypothetical protein
MIQVIPRDSIFNFSFSLRGYLTLCHNKERRMWGRCDRFFSLPIKRRARVSQTVNNLIKCIGLKLNRGEFAKCLARPYVDGARHRRHFCRDKSYKLLNRSGMKYPARVERFSENSFMFSINETPTFPGPHTHTSRIKTSTNSSS